MMWDMKYQPSQMGSQYAIKIVSRTNPEEWTQNLESLLFLPFGGLHQAWNYGAHCWLYCIVKPSIISIFTNRDRSWFSRYVPGHWRYPYSGEWSNDPNRASACFEGTKKWQMWIFWYLKPQFFWKKSERNFTEASRTSRAERHRDSSVNFGEMFRKPPVLSGASLDNFTWKFLAGGIRMEPPTTLVFLGRITGAVKGAAGSASLWGWLDDASFWFSW